MSRTRKPPKKSPSERLRGVFFQLYLEEKPMFVTSDEYYEEKMEMLIEHYKNKLNKKL